MAFVEDVTSDPSVKAHVSFRLADGVIFTVPSRLAEVSATAQDALEGADDAFPVSDDRIDCDALHEATIVLSHTLTVVQAARVVEAASSPAELPSNGAQVRAAFLWCSVQTDKQVLHALAWLKPTVRVSDVARDGSPLRVWLAATEAGGDAFSWDAREAIREHRWEMVSFLGRVGALDRSAASQVLRGTITYYKGPRAGTTADVEWPALMFAAWEGSVEGCEALLAAGADANGKDPNEYKAPLDRAAFNGHTRVCEVLLAAGANVNSQYSDGFTALHLAAQQGWPETCELLLAAGADVTIRANYGYEPLHQAAAFGELDPVKVLVGAGGDLERRDANGNTPLEVAAGSGWLEVCKWLVSKGARLESSADLARRSGHNAVQHWLEQQTSM